LVGELRAGQAPDRSDEDPGALAQLDDPLLLELLIRREHVDARRRNLGLLGGIAAAGCLAIAQAESMPRMARLGLIVLINAVLYAGILALVMQAAP
jgi:hypothetical protein